jgi:hypothetical protein
VAQGEALSSNPSTGKKRKKEKKKGGWIGTARLCGFAF